VYETFSYVEDNPIGRVDPLGLTTVHIGPVITTPTPNIDQACNSLGAYFYGCTFFPVGVGCNYTCENGVYRAHASLDISWIQVYYATNEINPNKTFPFGSPVAPSQALAEEMKHVTIIKALARMVKGSGDTWNQSRSNVKAIAMLPVMPGKLPRVPY